MWRKKTSGEEAMLRAAIFKIFRMVIKMELKEIIYRGTWEGLGEMYDIRVGDVYTTIVIKPGEDFQVRLKETKEKFAGRSVWCAQ